jgi:molybdopterin-binding protein
MSPNVSPQSHQGTKEHDGHEHIENVTSEHRTVLRVRPSILEGRGLHVVYQRQAVLDVPQVEVGEGEVLALIGPNGAGKSTLLRVLGLLETPTAGTVLYRGQATSPAGRQGLIIRRRFASVFQEPLLCDTTVRANAGLGLWLRGQPAAKARAKIQMWMERLGIAHLADRKARTLSGGEAQRTSLARAFAIDPEILLLDEPFAALDPPTRVELLALLQALLREAGCTTIFVTHDREEALQLGDRIVVIVDGRIRQIGRPADVFGRPASEEVARFVGMETLLSGRVIANQDGLLTVDAEGVRIMATGKAGLGETVLVGLRPEDITLRARDGQAVSESARNHLEGTVAAAVRLEAQYRIEVECGPRLVALVTKQSFEELYLVPGRAVLATFKASAVHLIRR